MSEEHKKHHEVHHHKKKGKLTIKKQDLWKFGTYSLGVLLIISLVFNFMPSESCDNDIDSVIENVETIMKSTDSVDVKASLEEVKGKLVEVSTQLAEVPAETAGGEFTGDKVKLDFYVMSQCPYGTQVMDAIAPVLEKLGDAVDFEANYISTDLGGGEFRSLHGEPETKGNIVQLCAAKYNPDQYMDMIVCQDKNMRAIPGNWEECAKEYDLDVESIRACYEGDEGKELLSTSVKKSNEAGAQGSPTIFLNGEPYRGGRGENDFLRSICNAFSGERPAACSDIPEPKKVDMIVLNDERCGRDCDVTGLISSLKSIFPGLDVNTIDYSTEEGKALFESTESKTLPVLLFDETVKEGEGYSNVKNYLVPAGDYTSLLIGSSFDPTKEICDNEVDDTGNDLVDCDDPDCEGALECRETKEEHLQVFIMSDCPYGRKAVEALKGVKDNFADLNFEIHYIANEAGDGFSSLHGQYEVDENIVQLCANKHSPAEWFDYMYCRSTKGVRGIDWKECAEETGVDVDKVEACFEGDEGKELLREDIKIANGLGVGASPTWMANNKYTFSGIDAETVKTNFCKYNSGVEGCENTLSSDTGGVAAGSC